MGFNGLDSSYEVTKEISDAVMRLFGFIELLGCLGYLGCWGYLGSLG